ncbi:MOP flippase family protein [Kineococcus sp. T13]|uniref:MOP flippase family protein n=1 Tax=Kineococcus vitellinus TaxID=2696565 RepID=UPI001412AD64|nr:MOP flippase family protein [Kineococcus vitellinus]
MTHGVEPAAGEQAAGEQAAAADERTAAAAAAATVDTSGSMKGAVVSGAKWAGMSKLGTQGLQFLAGLVLARLLAPADFGLLASIYVVTGFATLFFEMGLGAALVHQRSPSERDLSTVFWINAVSGVLYAGLMWAISPLIAEFFDAPRMTSLMPFVALAFTLSLGVVHYSILQRQLRFRTIAAVDLSSALVGHVTTVVAALLGAGTFALVSGPLVSTALTSVVLFCVVRWRPRHFVDRRSLRELWRFSGGMLGFNVVNYWGRNADNLLIGRFLGAAPLGLYGRGYNLMLLPVTQITGTLGRVMFPALAAVRDDHPRVRSMYLRSLGTINFVTIPVLVGLAATAEGLVPLLWGEQWTAVVPVLQVLCIAGVPQCVSTSVGWLYQSQGRTTTMFVMGIVGSVVGVVAMAVGLRWGIVGVAWGVLVKSWVMAPVALHVSGRVVGLRVTQTLRGAAPTLLTAAVMGVLVWYLPRVLGWDPASSGTVLVQVALGVLLYGAGSLLLQRPRLLETLRLARRRRG